MQTLRFNQLNSVLCLGAHPDDIEIGCGGTLLKLLEEQVKDVTWVVFSGNEVRRQEARDCAHRWLRDCECTSVQILDFDDGFFPACWGTIKRKLQEIAQTVSPDIVFTHHLNDRHQDHRVLSELTWQTFRNHTILEYEIPKYEGDRGQPNLYVELTESQLALKLDGLLQEHNSQAEKHWFDRELFQGCARQRGTECATRYAEAFHARKILV